MLFHPLPDAPGTAPVAQAARHFPDFMGGNAVDLGHFPHGSPPAEAHVIGHGSHAVRPVSLQQLFHEIVPFVPRKIHVDVGVVVAVRVQKPPEKEVVRDGVHVGDPQEIAHQAGRGASPPAVDGSPPHDVRHHQEVIHVALVPDEFQFFRQASFHGFGGPAVPPRDPLTASVQEELEMVFPAVFVVGKDRLEMVPVRPAHLGEFPGVGQDFRGVGEMAGHLPPAFEPPGRGNHLVGGKGAQGAVEVHGPNQPVQAVVFGIGEVHPVGRHGRNPQFP